MCVRALDYVPPIDLTFGEYLRALITADYNLVRDDDRGYRVSVLDAFRRWGIYPNDVNVLDEAAILWRPPVRWAAEALRELLDKMMPPDWTANLDRREVYLKMRENSRLFRQWVYANARSLEDGTTLGVMIFGSGRQSIPRNERNSPRFEVHSVRPAQRTTQVTSCSWP